MHICSALSFYCGRIFHGYSPILWACTDNETHNICIARVNTIFYYYSSENEYLLRAKEVGHRNHNAAAILGNGCYLKFKFNIPILNAFNLTRS